MSRSIKKSLIALTLAVATICVLPAALAQSAADCRAYAERAKNERSTMGGAARGAAGGALFGAIAGNAGMGAGIGALIGGISRSAKRQDTYNRVFDDCMRRGQ